MENGGIAVTSRAFSRGNRRSEASPYYLFHPGVPARAAAMLPETKFIVLLRDPVTRAYSHYLHSRALGAETLTFEQALDAEDTRLAKAESLGLDSRVGRSLHRDFSYVSRGMYASQLERWLAYVPQSRIKIIKSEDWHGKPREVYADLLSYLGLPCNIPERFTKANALGSSQHSSSINPTTYFRLRHQFATDSERVRSLLGWESCWS
ncbi:MAG: sulfotransferase domain-containing protein [Nocardioidaceae bacterium]